MSISRNDLLSNESLGDEVLGAEINYHYKCAAENSHIALASYKEGNYLKACRASSDAYDHIKNVFSLLEEANVELHIKLSIFLMKILELAAVCHNKIGSKKANFYSDEICETYKLISMDLPNPGSSEIKKWQCLVNELEGAKFERKGLLKDAANSYAKALSLFSPVQQFSKSEAEQILRLEKSFARVNLAK